jgi:tetratricopeptide (TPR) repeat protein
VSAGVAVAGRFEALGDPLEVRGARRRAIRGIEREPLTEEALWLRGTDRVTDAPVIIEPRGGVFEWVRDLQHEAMARQAAAMALPYLVPVLHAGPGVVYADPPPGLPRGTFTVEEAAELGLQACVATASLRARGVGLLCFDRSNLRVTGAPGSYRIAWLVPGVPEMAAIEAGRGRRPPWVADPVRRTVLGLLDFFCSLLPEVRAIIEPIARRAIGCADVAALARVLLSLLPASSPLAASVERLPRVEVLPPLPMDWDGIIADGEGLLATVNEHHREYVDLPLASAYHQRACRTWAAGDAAAALSDAERALALDPHLPYATTCAILLDALGRRAEARRAIDGALDPPVPEEQRRFHPRYKESDAAARARALGVRGMIALREGDAAGAEADLTGALAVKLPDHEAALHAHGLGAARYARGDFAGAAEAEARSVELAPENARYRWALVGSLRKLGRVREAREHAEAILAREPEAASHRERFARLFGAEEGS